MIAIFKKDLRSYFRSMQTFIYLALFSLFCGYYACRQFFLNGADGSAASALLNGICAAEALLLPLITMRSFAGERILHTDYLVLTAPIGPLSLAFGKFLACAALFALSLLPAFLLPFIIACMGYLSFGMSSRTNKNARPQNFFQGQAIKSSCGATLLRAVRRALIGTLTRSFSVTGSSVALYWVRRPFPCTLCGPFVRCAAAGLPPPPALCKPAYRFYFRFFGL